MTLPPNPWNIPLADMHVHLEGTMTPAMVKKIATRNGLPLPDGLFDETGTRFVWPDDGTAAGALKGFVKAYDIATSVMRGAEDYTDITRDYLMRVGAEGCIYAQIGISIDHGKTAGLSYPAMMAAIEKGLRQAQEYFPIEARFISTCVRHYGVEAAETVAEETRNHPHPLVTAFGMAGDENAFTVKDFLPAYERSGLAHRDGHAGEAAGAESVRAARDVLGLRTFGHMVRAAEDPVLMAELSTLRAVPQVCLSSNLCLKVFKTIGDSPLKQFFNSGMKPVLGSDDPSFFNTTIGTEYALAQKHFGFSPADLLRFTRHAIEEAFVDESTRACLLEKVEEAEKRLNTPSPKLSTFIPPSR